MLAVLGLPASAQAAEPDFHRCRDAAAGARCGHVGVPLDRLAPAGEKIRIGFELYRRRDRGRPALGTIVAVEGGPGYSSTDSRDYFLELARPLMDRRDLLLVDARGTGLSGPLDCPALRRTVAGYIRRAGRCAAQLGPRVDRYTTRASVDDLADVLDALGDRRRRPLRRLLRLVLRSGVRGQPSGPPALARPRRHVSAARHRPRARRPRRGHLAGAAARLRATAELRGARRGSARRAAADRRARPRAAGARHRHRRRGRAHPRAARHPGAGHGRPVGLRQPADVPRPVRRDARVRGRRPRAAAAARGRDEARSRRRRPCARSRTRSTSRSRATTTRRCGIPRRRSRPAGSSSPRPGRRCRAAQFAPFTGAEWTSLPYEGATACLRWPGPQRPEPPVDPQAPYPAVPTLVVNGDLDNITTTDQARVVASRFPSSTYVETRNTIHVSALGDRDGCAAPIVRRFIRTLSAGDTSCAGRIAEVRTVERFPRRSAGATPADPRPGDRSTVADRRVAAVAAATVADAIQRWLLNYDGSSRGLRGGRWTLERRPPHALPLQRRALHAATSRCTAARPGDSGPARSRRTSGSPAAAGCGRAGTCAARSRRPRSPAASADAACGRRCSRPERRRARAACAARACMEEGSSSGGLDRPRAVVARGSGHQVES